MVGHDVQRLGQPRFAFGSLLSKRGALGEFLVVNRDAGGRGDGNDLDAVDGSGDESTVDCRLSGSERVACAGVSVLLTTEYAAAAVAPAAMAAATRRALTTPLSTLR